MGEVEGTVVSSGPASREQGSNEMRVIVVLGNNVYHREDCYFANTPWVKNVHLRKDYSSIAMARSENRLLAPCKICCPPETD